MLADRLGKKTIWIQHRSPKRFSILRNAFRRPFKLPDVAVRSFGGVHREGQPLLPIDHTWLTVILKEASGITGSWGYKKDLFEANIQSIG